MRAVQAGLGFIGVALLFFGVTAYALTQELGFYVLLHLIAGLFALAAWAASGRERIRGFLGERSTRYGANAILYSALFVGVIIMANWLGTRYGFRFDTTEAQVYSLSPQSAQVVEDLPGDVELLAFVEGGQSPQLEELFESYEHRSARVTSRIIDPDKHPELAERYGISQYNTVRVGYGEQGTLVTDPGEESITNAIIKVTQSEQKTVCFVEGHGEPDPEDMENAAGHGRLRQALLGENYKVQKVLLAAEESVPEVCDLLIAGAPEKPYLDHEKKVFRDYLASRGRALVLFSARRLNELAPVVGEYGVDVGDDVVVDKVIRLFQGPALGLEPIADQYGSHPITEDFDQRTVFPLARSVQPDSEKPAVLQVTPLVKTSPQSWAETDLEAVFQRSEVALDPAEDRKGPISIAVAARADLEDLGGDLEGELRLVVFGSDDFVNNRTINSFYNRDLVLNAAGWAVGEERLVSIRPRTIRSSRVQLTQAETQRIFYLSVLILPEILLLIGIAVWASRRGA